MVYDIALIEKEGTNGLNFNEITLLYDFVSSVHTNRETEVYPLEIEAKEHESTAMGFITAKAANILDYDYKNSGFADFIASILDDMELEDKLAIDTYTIGAVTYRVYEFKGLKIWLNRN